jgi:hypothetical protein
MEAMLAGLFCTLTPTAAHKGFSFMFAIFLVDIIFEKLYGNIITKNEAVGPAARG